MPAKRKARSSNKDDASKKSRADTPTRIDEVEAAEASSETSVACSSSSKKEKKSPSRSERSVASVKKLTVREEKDDGDEPEARFIGDPLPDEEARRRWPKRYESKKKKQKNLQDDDEEEIIPAKCHYIRAEVDGHVIYDLYDDAHVQAGTNEPDYICKIVEMFEAVDGALYFTAQWYYRACDTVIERHSYLIDPKRVFFSEIQNVNPLECLVKKLKIARLPLNINLKAKESSIPTCDYYCDMLYLLPYTTFMNLPPVEDEIYGSEASSTISTDVDPNDCESGDHTKTEVKLLDLYAGCGAMSTGLCLGASLSDINLVTRWAVDLNEYACESLKLNHPETEVRNESAEDFLALLREWEKLCMSFSLIPRKDPQQQLYSFGDGSEEEDNDDGDDCNTDDGEDDAEIFVVEKILAVCYGDPNKKERGLHFKVRWESYGPSEDTWEPIGGLSNCGKRMKEFVTCGFQSMILPLPGDADVICGGPPCQGISGFNRFRNKVNPLDDEKNKQLLVFMNIVDFLKPKFVLMENVVDIVKFADGFLGRYALGRLIQMNYQVRMGMMAAGAYGLPQFRMRVFLWGALPTEKLPPYALPTHDVVVRGVIPTKFERCTVAYDEGQEVQLETKLLLEDAIADLPTVGNYESRDEMLYDKEPDTVFQRLIRLPKNGMNKDQLLYDHRPLQLNKDDYQRVCQVPKRKGANFRDFPGVHVRPDNKVEWDPNVQRVYLESGKPLVPDYAMTYVKGTSSKPFGRLWWDETVPTVVTRAEPHNQVILHPEQDRVLTVRENARLQGFPDYYKLCGPIKERYTQVGNAVAVPVSRALGFGLGMTLRGLASTEPLFTLPKGFPNIPQLTPAASSEGA